MRKIQLYNFLFLLVTGIGSTILFQGCEKNSTVQPANLTARLIDSIIVDSSNLHFIYDAQERIVEERLVYNDSLYERNTYEYNSSGRMPFKRNHFNRDETTPEYISYFQYDGNDKKIFDSSYYFQYNAYILTSIYRNSPGKIIVTQTSSFPQNMRSDTIFTNTAGNADSIRSYYNSTQPFGPLYHWHTATFAQFNNQENIFSSLNISQANFYIPGTAFNFGSYIHSYSPINIPFVIDYLNTNYFTAFGTRTIWNGEIFNIQKQIQFNSDNLPLEETVNFPPGSGYPVIVAKIVHR
ncbi:MAG: hypothetical protein V9E88_11075 [Ferruginibacter sp.]